MALVYRTLLAVALGFLTRKRNLLLVRKLFLLQSSDRWAIFFGWAVFRWTSKHKCLKAQTSAPEVPLSHVAMDYPVDAKPPEFRLFFKIHLSAHWLTKFLKGFVFYLQDVIKKTRMSDHSFRTPLLVSYTRCGDRTRDTGVKSLGLNHLTNRAKDQTNWSGLFLNVCSSEVTGQTFAIVAQ